MKSYLPFLTLAIFFASCSSVYKSGQTPDDVYFSPARPQDEYARVEKRDNRMYGNDDETLEDSYLRMRVRNPRYQFLEDGYDSYAYGSNYNSYFDYYRMNNYYAYNSNPWMWSGGYNKYYNPYYYNSYYSNPYYYNPYYANPYYSGVVYGNVYPVYNKPRRGNLNAYNGSGSYTPSMPKNNSRSFNTYQSTNTQDNYRNSGTNAGSFLRNTFGSGNNNSNSSSQPSSNNSSSGSSSTSSGSSHAPVRKF